jgi:hypothetical protein
VHGPAGAILSIALGGPHVLRRKRVGSPQAGHMPVMAPPRGSGGRMGDFRSAGVPQRHSCGTCLTDKLLI